MIDSFERRGRNISEKIMNIPLDLFFFIYLNKGVRLFKEMTQRKAEKIAAKAIRPSSTEWKTLVRHAHVIQTLINES